MHSFITKSIVTFCALSSLNLLGQAYTLQGQDIYQNFRQSMWLPGLNQIALQLQEGALHCWYRVRAQ